MSLFVPLTACGESFLLSYVTAEIRARYSAWCAAQAQLELAVQREFLPPELYRDKASALAADIAAKAYRWGSPHEKEAMGPGLGRMLQSGDGQVMLLSMLLREEHGNLPPDKVYAILMEDGGNSCADAINEARFGPNAPAREVPEGQTPRQPVKPTTKEAMNGTTPSRETIPA